MTMKNATAETQNFSQFYAEKVKIPACSARLGSKIFRLAICVKLKRKI